MNTDLHGRERRCATALEFYDTPCTQCTVSLNSIREFCDTEEQNAIVTVQVVIFRSLLSLRRSHF
jgi:hypothetical protein